MKPYLFISNKVVFSINKLSNFIISGNFDVLRNNYKYNFLYEKFHHKIIHIKNNYF